MGSAWGEFAGYGPPMPEYALSGDQAVARAVELGYEQEAAGHAVADALAHAGVSGYLRDHVVLMNNAGRFAVLEKVILTPDHVVPGAGVLASGISWDDNPADLLDTPLTMVQAVTVLTGLGYPPDLASTAVGRTVPGETSQLASHEIFIEDGGYVIARRPRWPELREGDDVREILAALREVDTWLDAACSQEYKDHPLAQDWARTAKVSEEIAEAREERMLALIERAHGRAIAELILATGQNPRKPADPDAGHRMLCELADVVVTGLLAIQHRTKDPDRTWGYFIAALTKALSRVPRERPEPED